MIFDGKVLSDITDADISRLVSDHVREHQHLEFKVTVNHGDTSAKAEVLRDIASLANGGGGYLIVGIRDDGHGKAQRFEPALVGDVQAIKREIMSLAQDHIRERITGIDAEPRTIDGNPILIVRVPKTDSRPHMVTFQDSTGFYTRYDDGKRAMTNAEIRDAFYTPSKPLLIMSAELVSPELYHARHYEERWPFSNQTWLIVTIKNVDNGVAKDLIVTLNGGPYNNIAYQLNPIGAGGSILERYRVDTYVPGQVMPGGSPFAIQLTYRGDGWQGGRVLLRATNNPPSSWDVAELIEPTRSG